MNRKLNHIMLSLKDLLLETERSPSGITRGFNNLQCFKGSGNELATQLADLLRSPSNEVSEVSLCYLGIARNHIGPDGVLQLSSCLASSPTRLRNVNKVEVFCNIACRQWFSEFFTSLLIGLPSLEVVDIGGMFEINNRGNEYVNCMYIAAQINRRKLRELHLDFLGLTDDCVGDLTGLVDILHLNCIFLEGNSISEASLEMLDAACRLNRCLWNPNNPISNVIPKELEYYKPMATIPIDYNYGRDALTLGDRIARVVIDSFLEKIPRKFCEMVRGQVVVAGFVNCSGGSIRVLSLAMGTSFVSYPGCGFNYDELVCDSHAEILARRALIHAVKKGAVHIDPAYDSVYMYTSTAPCGYDKKSKGAVELNKQLSVYKSCSSQRRSCLSKISRWLSECGWGGKHFPTHFPLSGVVVGRKYKAWCSDFGFIPSDAVGTLESRLASDFGVTSSIQKGDSDTAWFWSPAASEFIDGRVGRKLDGSKSTLCRVNLVSN